MNPEFGSPAYHALTVYSPDVSDPARYTGEVLVVFHGFMSAIPNGTFKRIRKRLHRHMTVIGINYAPLDVAETKRFLDEVAEKHLKGRRVTALGTSLGGFWARYFADRIRAHKLIMLNPVIDPRAQLGVWIGVDRFNRRRKESYHIEANAFDEYAALTGHHPYRPKTLLVLTADDGYMDPHKAKDYFSGQPDVELAWYETGGHTINLKKHPALDRIEQFIRGSPPASIPALTER